MARVAIPPQSTVTGPGGNTATRQASGAYNPATQSYGRTSTTTGPNGKSATSTSSTQLTGNGYVHSTTKTGPNGNSVTSTGQGSYNSATGHRESKPYHHGSQWWYRHGVTQCNRDARQLEDRST